MDDIELITPDQLAQKDLTLKCMITVLSWGPEKWVGDNTFRSVVLYLTGYDAAVGNLTGTGMFVNTDLMRFGCWLQKRMPASSGQTPGNHSWFACVEKLYLDDETRIRQLPILFDQFLSEQQRSVNTITEGAAS